MGGKTSKFLEKSEQQREKKLMTSINIDSNVKTRYIRSAKNPDQVMTLVTKVQDNTLTFAVAINAPPRKTTIDRTGHVVWGRAGDAFSKDRGKTLAVGRLECERSKHRHVVTFDPDTEHPLQVALRTLTSDTIRKENPRAAKIAADHSSRLLATLLRKKRSTLRKDLSSAVDIYAPLKAAPKLKATKPASPPKKKTAAKKTTTKAKITPQEKSKLNRALNKAVEDSKKRSRKK